MNTWYHPPQKFFGGPNFNFRKNLWGDLYFSDFVGGTSYFGGTCLYLYTFLGGPDISSFGIFCLMFHLKYNTFSKVLCFQFSQSVIESPIWMVLLSVRLIIGTEHLSNVLKYPQGGWNNLQNDPNHEPEILLICPLSYLSGLNAALSLYIRGGPKQAFFSKHVSAPSK